VFDFIIVVAIVTRQSEYKHSLTFRVRRMLS